jgi:hypothetical protein
MENLPMHAHSENFEHLRKVREGMEVFDNQGKKIGTASRVHLGEQGQAGTGAADLSDGPAGGDVSLPVTGTVPAVSDPGELYGQGYGGAAGVFGSDLIPDEMRQQLYMTGFVRMDSSRLLHGDRYIRPEQVERVEGDRVVLNAGYDNLLKI